MTVINIVVVNMLRFSTTEKCWNSNEVKIENSQQFWKASGKKSGNFYVKKLCNLKTNNRNHSKFSQNICISIFYIW